MSIVARARTLVSAVPHNLPSDVSGLPPSAVRRGLKLSLVEGMLAQVHLTISAGAFLTGFALLLGAGNLTLGIVAAMPFLIQPLQLLGAWLIERAGTRKPLAVGGSLGRTLWLVLLLLPYLPLSPTQRLWLLVFTLFVAQALISICANAWTNWMTDLVPPQLRGRYFSVRNTALAAVAMVVNAGAGYFLDRMRLLERPADGYAILFAAAVVCGAMATLLMSRQPEPAMRRRASLKLADLIPTTWRTPPFRRFLGAMVVWHMALGISAPFFSAYALRELGLAFTTLALFDVITAAISLVSLPLWGQLADRFGHRRVLLACMAGVIVLPWAWVLATPTAVWILFLNALVSGIWWPGLALAQGNRLMEQAPAEGRGIYLAAFAAATGLAYFSASTIGGVLADLLAGTQWALGSLHINNYQTLFVLSSLIRASVLLFGRKAL